VNKGSNPIYETSNDLYGQHLEIQKAQLETNRIITQPPRQSEFSFLYSRTSDVYGVDPTKQKAVEAFDYAGTKIDTIVENNSRPKRDVKKALELFTHEAKSQNPLYATSANDIGKKPPTEATFVAERAFRTQAFSRSFNHMKPKSSSLNTGLTKSTIHPTLDPQFM
jgi:hypothetical protein